ncbi:type II toxin-antitoxin system VapC family toxin, partial [Desulfobulbus sp. F5]|nr:type II toxin-antitoxin system VapC family toxin [Desulfobulbus sp. F5]
WDNRDQFELYISALVLQEAGAGDPDAAQKRLEQLDDIPELDITEEVEQLASILIQKVPLPAKARIDALHIAAAALNGMDYLLTWNCSHIANAVLRPKIEAVCRELGYEPPSICTPQELTRCE